MKKHSTGNYSTGNFSTGNYSTGNSSTGNYSTGDFSTGDSSTGNYSIGDSSTGDFSTGDSSTGNSSTGNYSTGDFSTGDSSTGSRSTGKYSTGSRSTGNWSISDHSVGHFSTENYSPFGFFDKPCSYKESIDFYFPDFLYFELTKWVSHENMSIEERKNNPSCGTNQGYLKVLDYKEAFKESWDNAEPEDRIKIKDLPNFCPVKFKEISGIDVDSQAEEMTLEEICLKLGKTIKIVKK